MILQSQIFASNFFVGPGSLQAFFSNVLEVTHADAECETGLLCQHSLMFCCEHCKQIPEMQQISPTACGQRSRPRPLDDSRHGVKQLFWKCKGVKIRMPALGGLIANQKRLCRKFMPPEARKESSENDWSGRIAKSEAEAKELYNSGIRQLRKALEFYTIEEHPIMHVNVTLEISELTRSNPLFTLLRSPHVVAATCTAS